VIADIFITTKNRALLLAQSLESLFECTSKDEVRITLVRDGDYAVTRTVADEFAGKIDYVLTSYENEGLGPGINMALAHIDAINRWWGHPTHGDPTKVAPFVVYCQDDLLYTPGWLEKLIRYFSAYERLEKIGFASGLECVEHSKKKTLPGGLLTKDWIRAANMFARREYWMSMFPIPRFDPETRSVRAKPNDGIGSGVDWWFIRNHENSVCRTGRTCLVIPGLVKHLGYKESTWLKRELPESASDIEAIEGLDRETESGLRR
jgi:glycosyltransferase involved in cell wall biosynthesis